MQSSFGDVATCYAETTRFDMYFPHTATRQLLGAAFVAKDLAVPSNVDNAIKAAKGAARNKAANDFKRMKKELAASFAEGLQDSVRGGMDTSIARQFCDSIQCANGGNKCMADGQNPNMAPFRDKNGNKVDFHAISRGCRSKEVLTQGERDARVNHR